MTEASENAYLVRVRAQVMCRDEGTGGWLALGGGGLAHVMIGRRPHQKPSESSDTSSAPGAPAEQPLPYEYYIHGKRISDNVVVLECTIREDFQYNKVMPTFHHWITNDKRFGLTFQTAADARAFDKGVKTCIDELNAAPKMNGAANTSKAGFVGPLVSDGWGGGWPSHYAYEKLNAGSKDDDEDNIFECLNLPSESRSSSENSTAERGASRPAPLAHTPILSAITLPKHEGGMTFEPAYDGKDDTDSDRCPYVHLSAVHDYTYPQMGSGVLSSEKSSPNTKPPLLSRDSGSLKKPYSGPPPLPHKKPTDTFQPRLKCRHCHEWYFESGNRAGSCEYAPDCVKACIECVTCIKCARCMLYHCLTDSDGGDFAVHPCTCTPPPENCVKRWFGLTLLSLLVPCLCCYPPLRLLHAAGRRLHVVGGHHAPMPHEVDTSFYK